VEWAVSAVRCGAGDERHRAELIGPLYGGVAPPNSVRESNNNTR